MSDTLTLEESGTGGCEPDPNPWHPKKGAAVTIINNSGMLQVLSNISPGLLTPVASERWIVVEKGQEWSGHVGSVKGTYTYNDGLSEGKSKRGVRTGTIDPT